MKINTLIGQLRILAILEGLSYISFAVTMPLKYVYGIKEPNLIVGMIHGGLFIAYCIWIMLVFIQRKLTIGETILLYISSIVPFMTYWAEFAILKKKQ